MLANHQLSLEQPAFSVPTLNLPGLSPVGPYSYSPFRHSRAGCPPLSLPLKFSIFRIILTPDNEPTAAKQRLSYQILLNYDWITKLDLIAPRCPSGCSTAIFPSVHRQAPHPRPRSTVSLYFLFSPLPPLFFCRSCISSPCPNPFFADNKRSGCLVVGSD